MPRTCFMGSSSFLNIQACTFKASILRASFFFLMAGRLQPQNPFILILLVHCCAPGLMAQRAAHDCNKRGANPWASTTLEDEQTFDELLKEGRKPISLKAVYPAQSRTGSSTPSAVCQESCASWPLHSLSHCTVTCFLIFSVPPFFVQTLIGD